MSNVKLAVVFYSMGGTNYQLAKWAAEGAKEAGADVKVLKVQELAPQSVIEGNEVWKACNKRHSSRNLRRYRVGRRYYIQYTNTFWQYGIPNETVS
nr:flavodoxin domain-containing protein [Bacillus licheniformis]